MSDTKQSNKEYAAELRARYAESGDAGMTDKEMICLLLSYTNVQSRLRETADALESHFGMVRYCYHARYADLLKIEGMTHHGAMIILLVGKLASMKIKASSSKKAVRSYEEMFTMMMCFARGEQVWAAAIGDDGKVVALEKLADGDSSQVSISIGVVMKFAAYHRVHKVIIAHSHPNSDNIEMSNADKNAMQYLGSVLNDVGISLIGQVIVAGQKAKLFEYANGSNI